MNNKVSFYFFCSLNEFFHVKTGRRLLPASFSTQAGSGAARQSRCLHVTGGAMDFECGQSYNFDKVNLRNKSSNQWVCVSFEGVQREESISWCLLVTGSHADSSHKNTHTSTKTSFSACK